MGSSLLRRNILDNLELLKITHQYQDINYNIENDELKLKITKDLDTIEYKLLLNNKLLFLKQEGKNINKEEYYILDGCIYNDLNKEFDLIYQKDNYAYTKNNVINNNTTYEVKNNLFIANLNISHIKIYYEKNKDKLGIIIHNKKYPIDLNNNIENQIKEALNISNKLIKNIKLKISLNKKQINNLINELNNIKTIYKNYIKYQIDPAVILFEVFRINRILEDVINSNEDEYYNEKIKIKKEI